MKNEIRDCSLQDNDTLKNSATITEYIDTHMPILFHSM